MFSFFLFDLRGVSYHEQKGWDFEMCLLFVARMSRPKTYKLQREYKSGRDNLLPEGSHTRTEGKTSGSFYVIRAK